MKRSGAITFIDSLCIRKSKTIKSLLELWPMQSAHTGAITKNANHDMAKSRDETVTRVKATAIEASIPCPKAGILTPNAVVNEAHRVLTTGEAGPPDN
jgi:hypothetical protein